MRVFGSCFHPELKLVKFAGYLFLKKINIPTVCARAFKKGFFPNQIFMSRGRDGTDDHAELAAFGGGVHVKVDGHL